MKRFLAFAAGLLLATSALAQNVQFPATQPGPPGQQSVWVQGGIGSNVKTYRLAVAANTWATLGEFVQIGGSATKTVRIQRITVGGAATAAVGTPIIVKRETSAISGGTCASQAANIAPVDNTNATAATATVNLCTAAPTAGTATFTMDSCRLLVAAVAAGTPDICNFSYGTNNDQPLTFTKSATDFVGLTNTVSFGSGGVLDLMVEWTEE